MATEAYKMDVGGLHGGAWTQISMVFQVNNAADDPNLFVAKELLDDFNADKMTLFRSLFPNEYAVEWLRARRISTGGGKSRTREYPGSSAQGLRTGDTASLSIAPIVKLTCGMTADTQGRIFLPAIAEPDLENNVYDSDYVNDVVTFFGGLVGWAGSLSSKTWTLSVWSKKLAGFFAVSAVTMSDVVGNQRKRRVPR